MTEVVEGVGDDRLVDEHEERQVGQEVQQVQRGNVLQLQSDGRLLLQADPPGLQLQEQLLGADEAALSSGFSSLLLQQEQEQLLHRSDTSSQHSCERVGAFAFLFALGQPRVTSTCFQSCLSAPVCTANAVQ